MPHEFDNLQLNGGELILASLAATLKGIELPTVLQRIEPALLVPICFVNQTALAEVATPQEIMPVDNDNDYYMTQIFGVNVTEIQDAAAIIRETTSGKLIWPVKALNVDKDATDGISFLRPAVKVAAGQGIEALMATSSDKGDSFYVVNGWLAPKGS